MGKSDNQANMGMLTAGDNNLMQYNEIDSIGYNALYFNGNNAQVKNNFINQFCLTADDGGGIYASGETSATGRLLEQNFVFNGRGNHNGTDGPNDVAASGIYLDDLSAGVDVESNSIANCSENGIFVHNGHDITVRNNTVYNAHTEVLYHHDVLGTAIRSISQYNNIFFSRDTAEVSMGLGNTAGGSNDFSSYGAYDSNYYCRPFNDTLNIQTNLNSSFTNYGLAGWTAAYGYDAHSNTSPSKLSPYAPQATGSAKFSNTTFDGGLTGFFALGNYDTLLIENKIDGNSLKFGTSSSTTTNLGLYFDIGSVTAGTKYLVTFKLQGRMDADFTLQLIENGGSFGGISELRSLHYNAAAQEYDIVFNATSSTSSLLVLQFEEKDAPIWIDDLDVHTATMVAVNPDDFIKYLFNYQSVTSTVSLDGTYLDARGNSYTGSITLGAWSSAVLIKQPTAIEVYRARPALQVGSPTVLEAATSFSIYPNPASNTINLALKGSMPAKAPLVLIYSLSGSLKTSFFMNSTTRQVNVTGWSGGMYIVRMVIDGKVQSQKLITL
jgi:parallel beta-helix repeat protein